MSDQKHGPQPKKWLVMLYIASDDKLNTDPGATLTDNCGAMLRDLENASKGGRLDLDNLVIVALIDSPYNDKTAKLENARLKPENRVYEYMTPSFRRLTRDGWEILDPISNEMDKVFYTVRDEADEYRKIASGSYRTMATFINWALRTYTNRLTMLSIIGHGGGWSPGFWEFERDLFPKPAQNGGPVDHYGDDSGFWLRRLLSSPPALAEFQAKRGGTVSPYPGLCPDYSDVTRYDVLIPPRTLSTPGLRYALENGIGGRGNTKLNVVFLDACLMGMVEVAYEIKDAADYLVAGEDLLYARLPYEDYLQNITAQTPQELAKSIVQVYNQPGSNLIQKSWSLAAIHLDKMTDLRSEINRLALELIGAVQQNFYLNYLIFEAYDRTQKFDYDADQDIDDLREGYIDLFDFMDQLSILFKNPDRYVGNGKPDNIAQVEASISKIKALLVGRAISTQAANSNLVSVLATSDMRYEQELLSQPGAQFRPVSMYSQADQDIRSDSAIMYSRSQTDIGGKRNLMRAYGLSIYAPLGEPDERHKDIPEDLKKEIFKILKVNQELPSIEQYFHGETYPSLYAKQLRFTNNKDEFTGATAIIDPVDREATGWTRLIEALRALRFRDNTRQRNLYERPYWAPRQRGF